MSVESTVVLAYFGPLPRRDVYEGRSLVVISMFHGICCSGLLGFVPIKLEFLLFNGSPICSGSIEAVFLGGAQLGLVGLDSVVERLNSGSEYRMSSFVAGDTRGDVGDFEATQRFLAAKKKSAFAFIHSKFYSMHREQVIVLVRSNITRSRESNRRHQPHRVLPNEIGGMYYPAV